MTEFEKWTKDIKNLIEKRVEKFAQTWIDNPKPDHSNIGIVFPEGQIFWMSFDQEEFSRNNESQRRSLIEIRRKDLAHQIKDFAETLTQTAKNLQ